MLPSFPQYEQPPTEDEMKRLGEYDLTQDRVREFLATQDEDMTIDVADPET